LCTVCNVRLYWQLCTKRNPVNVHSSRVHALQRPGVIRETSGKPRVALVGGDTTPPLRVTALAKKEKPGDGKRTSATKPRNRMSPSTSELAGPCNGSDEARYAAEEHRRIKKARYRRSYRRPKNGAQNCAREAKRDRRWKTMMRLLTFGGADHWPTAHHATRGQRQIERARREVRSTMRRQMTSAPNDGRR